MKRASLLLALFLAGCSSETYDDLRSKPSDNIRAQVACTPWGGVKAYQARHDNRLTVECINGVRITNIKREEVQRGKPVDHPAVK